MTAEEKRVHNATTIRRHRPAHEERKNVRHIPPNWTKDLPEQLDDTPAWARDLSAKLDKVLAELERLNAAGPQAQTAPLTHPTFCGYRCSWDIDDAGWPSYIHLEDGSLASHREKQGHHWYSVSLGDGKYGEHYLKFHRAAPPEGLLVMPPPAALDDAQAPAPAAEETPFGLADEARLRVMHQLGRVVHGEDWPKHGRELILAQSDGRTETSAQLTQAEVDRIISRLRQEQQEAA